MHQFTLSFAGLETFLLNAPRSNVIYANKEGIISLLGKEAPDLTLVKRLMSSGYLSLHFMGLSLGTIILPPSPSFFRKQQVILTEGSDSQRRIKLDPSAPRQEAKAAIELLSYALVWWTLLALVRRGLQVSRRMVGLASSRCTPRVCSRSTHIFSRCRRTCHIFFGSSPLTRRSSLRFIS